MRGGADGSRAGQFSTMSALRNLAAYPCPPCIPSFGRRTLALPSLPFVVRCPLSSSWLLQVKEISGFLDASELYSEAGERNDLKEWKKESRHDEGDGDVAKWLLLVLFSPRAFLSCFSALSVRQSSVSQRPSATPSKDVSPASPTSFDPLEQHHSLSDNSRRSSSTRQARLSTPWPIPPYDPARI